MGIENFLYAFQEALENGFVCIVLGIWESVGNDHVDKSKVV